MMYISTEEVSTWRTMVLGVNNALYHIIEIGRRGTSALYILPYSNSHRTNSEICHLACCHRWLKNQNCIFQISYLTTHFRPSDGTLLSILKLATPWSKNRILVIWCTDDSVENLFPFLKREFSSFPHRLTTSKFFPVDLEWQRAMSDECVQSLSCG